MIRDGKEQDEMDDEKWYCSAKCEKGAGSKISDRIGGRRMGGIDRLDPSPPEPKKRQRCSHRGCDKTFVYPKRLQTHEKRCRFKPRSETLPPDEQVAAEATAAAVQGEIPVEVLVEVVPPAVAQGSLPDANVTAAPGVNESSAAHHGHAEQDDEGDDCMENEEVSDDESCSVGSSFIASDSEDGEEDGEEDDEEDGDDAYASDGGCAPGSLAALLISRANAERAKRRRKDEQHPAYEDFERITRELEEAGKLRAARS